MRIYPCAYTHRYSRCILSSRTWTRGLHLFPQEEPLEHPERRRERQEFQSVPPSEPPSKAEWLESLAAHVHSERRRERLECPPVQPSEPPSKAQRPADDERSWEEFEKTNCLGSFKDIFKEMVPSTACLDGDLEDWEVGEDCDEVPVGVRPFV